MSFGSSSAGAADYETARDLVSQQKWNEALPMLKSLLEEEPDSVTIAKDLAQVLLRLNRREEALDVLKQHHLTKQAQIAAHSFLSKESFRFYQQGLDWLGKRSYPQAGERFEKALEKDQAQADILLRFAQCEILDGNGDLSTKLLDQLERIHGRTAESTAWRAKSLLLRGKPDEALPLLTAVTSDPKAMVDPLSEWATLWLGEAQLALGQKNPAIATYESDLKHSPMHLQVQLALEKLRVAGAESPNQFLQISSDLDSMDKKIETLKKAGPKKTRDFYLDPFDAEALQRGVTALRDTIRPQLPSPTPSVKGLTGQGQESKPDRKRSGK